jgi:flagellar biosynthesis/type III secretory pathway chaperone
MALLDAFRPAAALSDLLDKEKATILKSDFSTLEKLSKTKESLLVMVAKAQISPSDLKALKQRSEHNSRLLMASAKGIKSAREKLLSLRSTSRSFTAYGPAGKTTPIGNKSLTMKRKA